MMKLYKNILFIFLIAVTIFSCEVPYEPDTDESQQQYVVEGFIEYGGDNLPTYVLITKSIPFLSEISAEKIGSLFVQDAIVEVSDGAKKVELQKLCTNNLPTEIKAEVLKSFGLNPDSTKVNICVYVDILNQIKKVEGGKYDLKITIGNTILTSSTTIPKNVPLYNFRWSEPPGQPSDTLARLWAKINDPKEPNYYRILTTDKDTNRFESGGVTVTDDVFFNGQDFEFPIQKNENFDVVDSTRTPNTIGLFKRGKNYKIKWMVLDKAHYDFWQTRDASAVRQGPFASYIRIKGNIKGGLGIWGGFASNVYELYCPPK